MTIQEVKQILGVTNHTTVKAAYKAKCLQYHPDRGGDVDAFQRVQAAYEVLKEVGMMESSEDKICIEWTLQRGWYSPDGVDVVDILSRFHGFM